MSFAAIPAAPPSRLATVAVGHLGRASLPAELGAIAAGCEHCLPRRPCHERAIHSGPDQPSTDNQGQPSSSLDLRGFIPPQVTVLSDLACKQVITDKPFSAHVACSTIIRA
jgi:hypothetical protein